MPSKQDSTFRSLASNLVKLLQHLVGVLLRVVEHSGANAALVVGAGEHVEVDASLTAAPESGVIGELFERHGTISQLVVDLLLQLSM